MRIALNARHQQCLWHWVWPVVRSQLLMAVKSCLIYCSRACPDNHFNQKHGSPIASCILSNLHAHACDVFTNCWCGRPDLQSVVVIYVKVTWILPLHHCIKMPMRYGYEYAWVAWQSDIASLLNERSHKGTHWLPAIQSWAKQHELPPYDCTRGGKQQFLEAQSAWLAAMACAIDSLAV